MSSPAIRMKPKKVVLPRTVVYKFAHSYVDELEGCLIQAREVLKHQGYSVDSTLISMIDKVLAQKKKELEPQPRSGIVAK